MDISSYTADFAEYFVSNRKIADSKTASVSTSDNGSVSFSDTFAATVKDDITQCPYGALAKDGVITYGKATFICDTSTNSICLGDMSEKSKVLNVNLKGGGHLKFNIDNMDELSSAMGMFCPEDVESILDAIAQYNQCTSKINEAEDAEDNAVSDALDSSNELDQTYSLEGNSQSDGFSVQNAMDMLKSYSSNLYEKLQNNDVEPKIAIGSKEYTATQWNKLMDTFDKQEDAIKEEDREFIEELEEQAEENADVRAEIRDEDLSDLNKTA